MVLDLFLNAVLAVVLVWGKTKSTPSPQAEAWTLDWSLTKSVNKLRLAVPSSGLDQA